MCGWLSSLWREQKLGLQVPGKAQQHSTNHSASLLSTVCCASGGCWPDQGAHRMVACMTKVGGGWAAVVLAAAKWWHKRLEQRRREDLPMSSNTTSEALHRSKSRDTGGMLLIDCLLLSCWR